MTAVVPEILVNGAYQFHFAPAPLVSQTQLFMLGKEDRRTADYRLDGLKRPEKNHFLLQYTLAGCGMLRLGKQLHPIPPGTAMLLHFPDDNEYFIHPHEGRWEFVYIMVQGHALEPIWMDAIHSLGPMPRLRRTDPLLMLLYRQIMTAQENRIQDPYEASRIAYDFSMELARTAAQKASASYPALVAQAIEILSREYAQIQGMDQLAYQLHVSKPHLIRTFSQATGLTPGRYLLHIRMRHAVVLLQDPSLTLEEIAHRLGYDNGNYFSKVFFQYFHVRPTAYRRDPMNAYAHITF